MYIQLICLLFLLVGCSTAQLPESSIRDPATSDLMRTSLKLKKDGSRANKWENTALIGNFIVNSQVLDNGLRILVVEDHSSPTFAYQTWFRVGSRDEDHGHTGLAHFFEHMMFKGTKSVKEGEFDRLLEQAGVVGENAFTSHDYTAYVQELPKDKIELIMKLEADRMVNLIVDTKGFNTEREVVQNERRFRTENSPDGVINEELFTLAFKRHPYHWPIIGYEKDLKGMTEKNAESFYQRFYSPNHATVIIVGDVNPSQILSLANQYYGSLSPQQAPSRFIVKEPPQMAPRRKVLRLNVQVEKLLIGYHIPNAKSFDMRALDVLQNILAGSKSSRLDQALVEAGIATTVEAGNFDNKDPSLFIIGANMQKNKKATQAENIILREIKKLANTPVSKEELQTAKNKISFGFFEGLGSNYDKAAYLGHYEAVQGDFHAGLRHYEQIQKVTAIQVRAVAAKYFTPRNRTVISGIQKGGKSR
ncbi:MAG: pitrilysin family protein [Bdellovibrionia bacterium]